MWNETTGWRDTVGNYQKDLQPFEEAMTAIEQSSNIFP